MNDVIWAIYVYQRRTGDLVDTFTPRDTTREATLNELRRLNKWYESSDYIWRLQQWVTSATRPLMRYRGGRRSIDDKETIL